MQLLAKMCGWLAPEKFKHGASDELTELLKRLRGSGSRHLNNEPSGAHFEVNGN